MKTKKKIHFRRNYSWLSGSFILLRLNHFLFISNIKFTITSHSVVFTMIPWCHRLTTLRSFHICVFPSGRSFAFNQPVIKSLTLYKKHFTIHQNYVYAVEIESYLFFLIYSNRFIWSFQAFHVLCLFETFNKHLNKMYYLQL